MKGMLPLVIALALMPLAAGAQNLLVEPSFEDWTNVWTRSGTAPGSAHWDSRWIKRTDARTGECFMMAVKHNELEPFDDTTPVDVAFHQSVNGIRPGEYEASLFFRVGGEGDRWDGLGGADQWTRIVVYLWADEARKKLVRTVMSPKIEIPVSRWHKFAVPFEVPAAGVKSASFYCLARLIDRTPRAWVAWDDAYLGPVGRDVDVLDRQECHSLLMGGWFEFLDSISPTFEVGPDASKAALDNQVRHAGGASLRMAHDSIAGTFVSQRIPFDCKDGARRVRASVWVKTKDVVRGKMPWYGVREIVWFHDADDKPIKQMSSNVYDIVPYFTGSRDWTLCQRTLVVPRATASLYVQFCLDNASGTAWFDDAKVEEVFDDYLVREDASVRIEVGGEPTSTMLEGFGWAWETVTVDRFSPLEFSLWPELFERMAWDGPEMIKVLVFPAMCPPKEYVVGKDTGQPFTYDFDTPPIKQLCTLLEACDRVGASVHLMNMHSGYQEFPGVPNGQWLRRPYYEGAGPEIRADRPPDWLMPYSKDRMAEYLAELLYHFRVTKGYRCVKYVSVWNEPGDWVEIGEYPDGLLEIYELLDSKLRAKGIRDKIKLIGLEMVEWGPLVRRTADIVRRSPFIDIATVHDYYCGLPFATETTSSWPLDTSLAELAPVVRDLRNMRGTGVPLMMTETNGAGTYPIYSVRDQYLACLGGCEYAIELASLGLDAMLKWQYNQPGWMQFCPFRFEDGHAKPNPWTYYPWAMLSRWSVRGSGVLPTKISGGLDENGVKRVRALALRSPGGKMSVVVINDGRIPKSVTIQLASTTQAEWRHYYYDSSLPDGVLEADRPIISAGALKAKVPPESVNVFTTFEVGLTGPAPR